MIHSKRPVTAIAATILLTLGIAGNINQVIAGSSTASLSVTANVNAKCMLGNTTPVAFGTYDPVVANASTPLDANGSFTVQCTKGSTGTLTLNNGLYNSNASGTTRAMKASGSSTYLNYDLYTSNTYATVWNATTNTVSYGPAANSSPYTETVYGQIPSVATNSANGNVTADSYADTVTVTVTY